MWKKVKFDIFKVTPIKCNKQMQLGYLELQFSFRNRQKSHETKSGEYYGSYMVFAAFFLCCVSNS